MTRPLALVALLAVLLSAPAAHAHGTRSVTVDVTEVTPGKAIVHLRSSTPGALLRIRAEFSPPCVMVPVDENTDEVTRVACPGSVAGSRITVFGLGPILSEAILVVSLQDGQRLSRVLTQVDPSFVLPAVESGFAVARSYVRLGIVHILTGYDHLLFLLALVLLLRRPRAVLLAETAFTVSHSLSFSATALGLVHVSAPAAEAVIALSLVLVALDIGRSPDRSDASEPQGVLMAFAFGLVHGLGFAGGLREIGLPDVHVSLALAGFAAGVEIGQVAFLLLALLVLLFASRRLAPSRVEVGVRWGYRLIGGVASYWLIERTVAVLSFHV
jgi:hydrogenase/urease accessory protein HupE